MAELQRAKRALAGPLIRVAVDVQAPGGQQGTHATREERKVAHWMGAVPIDHRLQTLGHPARVAPGRKEKDEAFDITYAGQRHDRHGDQDQPRLPPGYPVLDQRFALLDTRQISSPAVDRTAVTVEADLAGSGASD